MLLVPAIQTQGSSPANVQATPGMVVFGTPGGRNGNEGRLQVDGLGVGAARNGGGVSGYNADIANAQEISFTVSAGLGEAEVSGPSLSVVPKTGGNALRGSLFLAGVSEGMVGSNYTPELEAAGLGTPGRLLQLWDYTVGIGGPIKKDRLWYFLNLRNQGIAFVGVGHVCEPERGRSHEVDVPGGRDATVTDRRQLDGRQPPPHAAGDTAQQVQHLLGRAEAMHRRHLFGQRRWVPDAAGRGRIRLRRFGRSPRRKPPPTRTGSSVCSSSRGIRR